VLPGEGVASPRYMGIGKYPAVDVYSMKTGIYMYLQEGYKTTTNSEGYSLRNKI
jgi:hypothetical protein